MIAAGRPSPLRAGFTLIEVLIVIAIISVLASLALPSLGTMVATGRERSTVDKLTQDFDWLRVQAASAAASLTLNPDCTWTATVNGAIDAVHSMTAATLTSRAIQLSCQNGTLTLPVTFAFSTQGYSSASGTLTVVGGHGQSWPLQVLYSGSIVNNQNSH